MEDIDLLTIAVAYRKRKKRLQQRRFWVHPIIWSPRGFEYYKHLIGKLRNYEDKFFEYFRMIPAVFDELVCELHDTLLKLNTNYRDAVTPEGQVAVCVRFLASGDSFGSLALLFQLGKQTISNAIYDTCEAIWSCLQEKYLPTPDRSIWIENAKKFHDRWQFPHCIGAIDGKHVVMQCPANSGSLCFNYKDK